MWEALGEARLPPLVVGSVPPICASTPVRLKRALEKLEDVIRTKRRKREPSAAPERSGPKIKLTR